MVKSDNEIISVCPRSERERGGERGRWREGGSGRDLTTCLNPSHISNKKPALLSTNLNYEKCNQPNVSLFTFVSRDWRWLRSFNRMLRPWPVVTVRQQTFLQSVLLWRKKLKYSPRSLDLISVHYIVMSMRICVSVNHEWIIESDPPWSQSMWKNVPRWRFLQKCVTMHEMLIPYVLLPVVPICCMQLSKPMKGPYIYQVSTYSSVRFCEGPFHGVLLSRNEKHRTLSASAFML